MILKLTSNGRAVVGTREDGATVSYSIEAEEFKQWLLEGNTPEPEDAPTPEQLLASLKAIKDKAVADKLALMQYDSLTTVKLWADDAVYGTEATAILNWYKAVTSMSIKLENDVKAGTAPIPTEAEYKTMIEGVV